MNIQVTPKNSTTIHAYALTEVASMHGGKSKA